jgi:uncharacterized OB-fold protein
MTSEPIMHDLTVDYYASLADGRLTVQQCGDCGQKIMYPRYRCTNCFSSNLDWADDTGEGVLHSFTIQRLGAPTEFGADGPYAVGIVKLDSGPQMLGRLWPNEDGTWDHYTCDDRVVFRSAAADEIAQHPAAWFAAAPA